MNNDTTAEEELKTMTQRLWAQVEATEKVAKERDAQQALAGELIAAIRVNMLRGTFADSTPEQVENWLVPFIARLKKSETAPCALPRLDRIRNRCVTLEKKHRWQLDLRWLGKWWGNAGHGHGRPFYQNYCSEYHHGWTLARHIWLGPFMVYWAKNLTWNEKHAPDKPQ